MITVSYFFAQIPCLLLDECVILLLQKRETGKADGDASKERVPADGTRVIWEMGAVVLMMLLVVVDVRVVHHWDGSF